MTEFDLTKPYCFYFNELTKIPHGSLNEKAISDFVVKFAEERGLQVKQDASWNVMIDKPASKGYENAKPLILQAHMDMVCVKESDSKHDFTKDPLKLYVDEEGWLHATDTTLGADDGMGVAYMLAILDDDSLVHPALECIFTTAEEIGLVGAQKLTPEDVHADQLICLDGGGETMTGISSAGGCDVSLDYDFEMEKNDDLTYVLKIRGLKGGHSGGQIALELGNADTSAVRILQEIMHQGIDVQLVSLEGGSKDNAIPSMCDIVFTSKAELGKIKNKVKESADKIKVELEHSDEGFNAVIEEFEKAEEHASISSSKALLDYIYVMPNGFQHRSMAIAGLTVTSLNLGIMNTVGNHVHMQTLLRSSMESAVDHLVGQLTCLAECYGVAVNTEGRYPGWNYAEVSPLRDIYQKVLKNNGKELTSIAVHGGNECGVFSGLRPGIDIITFGAICKDIHTPKEKLDLSSFDRSYEILCSIIKKSAS